MTGATTGPLTGAPGQGGAAPRLALRGLSKRYDRTQALDGVDLAVEAGEVHALLGENGAGKSTLIRILAGATAADAGEILLDGRKVVIRTPADALRLGIGVIHQQLSVAESLTVAENFLLRPSGVAARALLPSRKAAAAEASARLARLAAAISPEARCDALGFGERQLVDIAIAASSRVRVLVMDEPTSGLSAREQGPLIEVIARLKQAGVAVIYVSHKLNEVYRIADRITVLREGRNVASFQRGALDPDAVIAAIVGRSGGTSMVPRDRGGAAAERPPVLVVDRLSTERVHGASLSVRPGEIVGVYGVVGSGCTQLLEAIWGARPYRGRVELDGAPLWLRSTAHRRRRGLGFVPADHRARGVVGHLSVRENMLLGEGRRRGGLFRREDPGLSARLARAVARLRIRCRDLNQPVEELSGGNQQKVVFARWLVHPPRVLLLEDPTQGIDVGARVDLGQAIRRACGEGAAVVMVSSDAAELAALADRIVVMRDGLFVGELEGAAIEEHRILSLASAA